MSEMPAFPEACAECGEEFDTEELSTVSGVRACFTCAPIVRAEAAECQRSDEHDYHLDRGI